MSEPSNPADLHRLLAEIDEEVRAKRASGELPAELERELDAVFARFAPAGALGGDFDALVERAEQQAFIDLIAPNESARPGVPYVKRVVQKTVRWYIRYVAEQFTGFAHTLTKAMIRLGDRVKVVEQLRVPDEQFGAVLASDDKGARLVDEWATAIVEYMAGVEGRVLHTRCRTGVLVKSLMQAGVDAYGSEPAPELVSQGVNADASLDLRPDGEVAHLRAAAPGALSGLVLSGGVDVLARGTQLELIDLAALALGKNGRLAVVVAGQDEFANLYSPVVVDLGI